MNEHNSAKLLAIGEEIAQELAAGIGGEEEALLMEGEVLPAAEEIEAAVPTVEELLREMELRKAVLSMREQGKARELELRQALQQAFFERDTKDFLEKHPEVDLVKLDGNPLFRRFCGSRYGMESLAKLYEDYREIVGGAEKAARAAVQSRSKRSTGSGGGGGDILTAKQRASLEAWNRANPDMKMTAREFLHN